MTSGARVTVRLMTGEKIVFPTSIESAEEIMAWWGQFSYLPPRKRRSHLSGYDVDNEYVRIAWSAIAAISAKRA